MSSAGILPEWRKHAGSCSVSGTGTGKSSRSGGDLLPFLHTDSVKREEPSWAAGEICRGGKSILKSADKRKTVLPAAHPGLTKVSARRQQKEAAEWVDQ